MEATETPVAPLEVRATVHLPGLPLGATALVNPTAPYVATCLERGYVVPVNAGPDPGSPEDG